MAKTRVLIADDHSFVREGASQLIGAQTDLEVVGNVDNGDSLIQKARELHPDIVVLDISIPDINGLDLIVLLKRASPNSRIVILSFHREPMIIRRALSSGAKAYVAKTAPVTELLDAIRAVQDGQTYLSSHIDPGLSNSTTTTQHPPQPYDLLSEREQQVFRLGSPRQNEPADRRSVVHQPSHRRETSRLDASKTRHEGHARTGALCRPAWRHPR